MWINSYVCGWMDECVRVRTLRSPLHVSLGVHNECISIWSVGNPELIAIQHVLRTLPIRTIIVWKSVCIYICVCVYICVFMSCGWREGRGERVSMRMSAYVSMRRDCIWRGSVFEWERLYVWENNLLFSFNLHRHNIRTWTALTHCQRTHMLATNQLKLRHTLSHLLHTLSLPHTHSFTHLWFTSTHFHSC